MPGLTAVNTQTLVQALMLVLSAAGVGAAVGGFVTLNGFALVAGGVLLVVANLLWGLTAPVNEWGRR
jgi:hypothetical protein